MAIAAILLARPVGPEIFFRMEEIYRNGTEGSNPACSAINLFATVRMRSENHLLAGT